MADCHVYLIAHKDADGAFVSPVKVGITKSLGSRLASLQTGNPKPIGLVFAFNTPAFEFARYFEQAFHELNAERRLNGEWFDMEPRDALFKMTLYTWKTLTIELGEDEDILVAALEQCGVNLAVKALDKLPPNERCQYGPKQ